VNEAPRDQVALLDLQAIQEVLDLQDLKEIGVHQEVEAPQEDLDL